MTEDKLPTGPSEALTSLEFFTGETLVDKLARRIVSCWHKTTEGILELARACADADDKLAGDDKKPAKKALIDKLPFSPTTFSKLATIGHDLRLQPLAAQLPQSFTTIYELTQFDDRQLNAAIKAGAIHPQVRRTEVQALREPNRKVKPDTEVLEVPATVSEIAAGDRCELVIPNDLRPDDGVRIGQVLQRLKKFGVEIVAIKSTEPHRDS